MKKTNFDCYLEEQLKNPAFAERFARVRVVFEPEKTARALRVSEAKATYGASRPRVNRT